MLSGPQQAVLAQLQVAEADLDRPRRDARSAGASRRAPEQLWEATLTRPATPPVVSQARHWVREQLTMVRRPSRVEDVELLVTELVINAVLQVGGRVTVTLRVQPTTLLIQVSDDSPILPRLNAFSDTAQTGRGMRLLQAARLVPKGFPWTCITARSCSSAPAAASAAPSLGSWPESPLG